MLQEVVVALRLTCGNWHIKGTGQSWLCSLVKAYLTGGGSQRRPSSFSACLSPSAHAGAPAPSGGSGLFVCHPRSLPLPVANLPLFSFRQLITIDSTHMTIRAIKKRQDRLLYEVAKAKHFEVGPWNELRKVREASTWVSKSYSFDVTLTGDTQLAKDLEELERCGFVNFCKVIVSPDADQRLNPNPNTWGARLTSDGLGRVHEHEKPWWVKAYEKQPVTAVQVIVTIALAVLSFTAGYYLGKH